MANTKIFLRANLGQYVCAEGGGGREVVANRQSPHQWETFEIISAANPSQLPNYGQRVFLKAINGQYLCAEGGGGREVVANRQSAHEWETFVLVKPTGTSASSAIIPGQMTPVAFRAWNGQYVCAEDGGGRELVANRNAVGPWETFSLLVAGTLTMVPLFPIYGVRDDQVTSGNHMHTWISLDKAGHLSGNTHTWTDNMWQGVHAVSNIAFLDADKSILWTSEDCVCGVAGKIDPTGPHDRVCTFSATVPGDKLNQIRAVAICHRADPHSLFIDWVKSPVGTAVIVVVAVAVGLTVAGSLTG
ncbi:MAG TPA: hypothetical protein VGJ94_04790 [Syntrophorhabdaceae bacterium]|jgi:hypothetical protein